MVRNEIDNYVLYTTRCGSGQGISKEKNVLRTMIKKYDVINLDYIFEEDDPLS